MVAGPCGIYSTEPAINRRVPTPPYRRPRDKPGGFVLARNEIHPMPDVEFPQFRRPQMQSSEIEVSEIEVSEVEVSEIEVSEIESPDTELPEVEWPQDQKLQIEWPEEQSREIDVPAKVMVKNPVLSSMDGSISSEGAVTINDTPPNTPPNTPQRHASQLSIDMPLRVTNKRYPLHVREFGQAPHVSSASKS